MANQYPLRVELPKGQHAMLRDPEDVTEGRRRPYLDAVERATMAMLEHGEITAEELQRAQATSVDDLPPDARKRHEQLVVKVGMAAMRGGARALQREAQDLLLLALAESWSYAFAVDVRGVAQLPGGAYDALVAVCEGLAPKMSVDLNPSPDPDSPTWPSNA